MKNTSFQPPQDSYDARRIKCSLKVKRWPYIQCSNVAKFSFGEKYPSLLVFDTKNLGKHDFALVSSKCLSRSRSTLLEFINKMSHMMSTSVLNTPRSN